MKPTEVVATRAEAEALDGDALLVLEPLAALLDAAGLGWGRLRARRIGEGHSNVTFALERGRERWVLRRPPRPPLPPSAHDVLREARLLQGLERAGARVPHVVLVCDDASLLGVPFYVMDHIEGQVVSERMPPAIDRVDERRALGHELIDALVEIHGVDRVAAGLDWLGRPSGYLERQVRRFSSLWAHNATRTLPLVEELARWLDAHRPESREATVVHGDYRLGNLLVASSSPARVLAVLDWELATVGDPLADLGYLVGTWSAPGSPGTPLELSPATRAPGFPTREELVGRYAERTGRSIESLRWYEALALWKGAIFCEAIYGRFRRGEVDDRFSRSLERGVPRLLEVAAEKTVAATAEAVTVRARVLKQS